tara:strand:+ start:623 stop:826 length:204 start_codon:yes stop_codon:yes gene_type:complete
MIKWVLVYIMMQGTQPVAVNAHGPNEYFDEMIDCFYARDDLAITVGGEDGFFPNGMQGVCVAIEVAE